MALQKTRLAILSALALLPQAFAQTFGDDASIDGVRQGTYCGTVDDRYSFSPPELPLSNESFSSNEIIVVPTHFHVAVESENWIDGWVGPDTLDRQLRIMNEQYSPYGIRFLLASDPTYYIGNNYARVNAAEDWPARVNRRGSTAALNLLFVMELELGASLQGRCMLPGNGDEGLLGDICIVKTTTLLHSNADIRFSYGMVTVHEIGHWFGLRHTFGYGGYPAACRADSDLVPDTPKQWGPTNGCPLVEHTICEGETGDNLHNHMNYVYDTCKLSGRGFTSGQENRMRRVWANYRKSFLTAEEKALVKKGQGQTESGPQNRTTSPEGASDTSGGMPRIGSRQSGLKLNVLTEPRHEWWSTMMLAGAGVAFGFL